MTLFLLALLAGCPDTANVATGGGSQAKATLDRVRVDADLGAIRATIKLYQQTNEGQNPPDLGALTLSALNYPDKYVYDASTGTVSCPEFGR
jgi:hypothetical protein